MPLEINCDKGRPDNLFSKGNPIVVSTLFRHVKSAIFLPEPAALDIFSYPEKLKERYEW